MGWSPDPGPPAAGMFPAIFFRRNVNDERILNLHPQAYSKACGLFLFLRILIKYIFIEAAQNQTANQKEEYDRLLRAARQKKNERLYLRSSPYTGCLHCAVQICCHLSMTVDSFFAKSTRKFFNSRVLFEVGLFYSPFRSVFFSYNDEIGEAYNKSK